MNSTPLNTAMAAGAGAVVAPVVAYASSALHLNLPVDVQGSFVVLIVAGAHWISQQVAARNAPKPATPAE